MRLAGVQQRAAAEAVADGRAAGDAGVGDDRGDLRDEAGRGVRLARIAVAHAAEVERDDAMVLGEPRRDEVPPVRMREEAVQQQQRRSVARARPFEIVQADAGAVEGVRDAGARERTGDELVEAAALGDVSGRGGGGLHRASGTPIQLTANSRGRSTAAMIRPIHRILPLIAAAALAAMTAEAAEPRIVPTPRGLPVSNSGASRPFLFQDLAARGYADAEFTLKGLASVIDWDAAGTDVVARGAPVPYATRLLVRRPVDARRFSGLVVLELLDPTTLQDTAPVWTAAQEELVRAGHVWAGLTIKPVAIEALKRQDATRYGSLGFAFRQSPECRPAPGLPGVPGSDGAALASPTSENGLAWDVIAQAGALIRSGSRENPLRDLEPRRLVVAGSGEAADYSRHVPQRAAAAAAARRRQLGVRRLSAGRRRARRRAARINAPSVPPVTDARRQLAPRGVPVISVATTSELARARCICGATTATTPAISSAATKSPVRR